MGRNVVRTVYGYAVIKIKNKHLQTKLARCSVLVITIIVVNRV